MKLTKPQKAYYNNSIENPEILYKGNRVKHASISLEDICGDINKKSNRQTDKIKTATTNRNKGKSLIDDDLFYCSIELDKLYIEYIEFVSYFNSIYLKWQKDLNDNPSISTFFPSEINTSSLSTVDSVISHSNNNREIEIEAFFHDINRNIKEIDELISHFNCSKVDDDCTLIPKQHTKSRSDLIGITTRITPTTALIPKSSISKYETFSKEHKLPTSTGLKKTKAIRITHSKEESFDDSEKEEIEKNNNPTNPPQSDSFLLPTSGDNQQYHLSTFQPPLKAQTTNQPDLNNISDINFTNLEINDESIAQNNNFHHVQIIDEDVENFKRRLDIMIKNFRTDTLKDFMGIKRNLLIEQKSVIESERQKCEALLSSKGDLVEHLKEDLAKTQHELNSQITIKEKITTIIFKDKFSKYQKKLKQKAFCSVLKKYHDKKKNKKRKEGLIRKGYHLRLKNVIFANLKQNWKEMKLYKIVFSKEKECQDKLNEMAQYYGKEISDLKNRLNEANIIIEKTKEAKNATQENLKKVLMRGVMAMNMEAMSVLDTNNINPGEQIGMNILSPLMGNQTHLQSNSNPIIDVNQSFTPSNISNQPNPNMNINMTQTNQMNPMHHESFNPNPIAKDSNWINASAVPSNMKSNLIGKDTFNDYNNNSNDIHNTYSDFNDEEINSRQYNITPMNQIENKYKGGSQIANLLPFNSNPNSNYYDEMQKNLSNIKDEFSSIKQNSMIDDDSFNNPSSGIINSTYQQPYMNMNVNANDIGSKMSNNSTVSNTNIINQQSIIKGQSNVTVNVNNKKKGIQANNSKGNIASNNSANANVNNNVSNIPPKTALNKGKPIKK